MRFFLLSTILAFLTPGLAQTYDSYNIDLLGHIAPNTTDVGSDGRKYSGCWGWHQTSSNKEYAIIGASNGTYFIDVSAPTTPSVCAFVPGKTGCTWREVKTYQNYCYIVSDDGRPNRFQIVDMSSLPASVNVTHDDSTLIMRGHTIWIDQDKMYIGGLSRLVSTNSVVTAPMAIYSLATPSAPVLLRELSDDISTSVIPYVHDMYVRNDTVYASCAFQGLYVLKYNASANTFSILGSYSNYAAQGYNHSNFLTDNGQYLVFCDEIPDAMPIRLLDVQNLSNIQPVKTFKPFNGTTPHNPYIVGNDFAVVSCYQDGLYIYNISAPPLVSYSGFFDTYPQGGFQQNNYSGTYRGNWGAYPFLPSGIIIANDMQNGVFILDPTDAYNTTEVNPVSLNETLLQDVKISIYPNPASDEFRIRYSSNDALQYKLFTASGVLVLSGKVEKNGTSIKTKELAQGIYFLQFESNLGQQTQKLIISHQ